MALFITLRYYLKVVTSFRNKSFNSKDEPPASNRTQSFTYDSLNRITSAQTAATNQPRFQGDTDNIHQCWAETYSFDPWGNLLSIKPSTSSLYTGCTQESGFDFTNFTGTNNLNLGGGAVTLANLANGANRTVTINGSVLFSVGVW
jgi:hypothetical protein